MDISFVYTYSIDDVLPWTAHYHLPTVIYAKCCNTCFLLKEKWKPPKSHNTVPEFRNTDQYFSIATCYIYLSTATTDILPLTEFNALQQLLEPSMPLPVKPMKWLSSTLLVPTQKQNWASLGNHTRPKCNMVWICWRWYFCHHHETEVPHFRGHHKPPKQNS